MKALVRSLVLLFFIASVTILGCKTKQKFTPIEPPKNDTSTRYEKVTTVDTLWLSDTKFVIQYKDTTKCPPSKGDTFIISTKNCNCPAIEIKTTERIKTDTVINREMTQRFYNALVQNDSLKAEIVKKSVKIDRLQKNLKWSLIALGTLILLLIGKFYFKKWQLPLKWLTRLKKPR